jgi:heme-degrading monooxygenase HmoA
MYGTVAKLKIAPGDEAKMIELMNSGDMANIPGLISSTCYKLDSGGDAYILAVVFESKASYVANAQSPEQNARYQKMRALLAADPEWMDGEIIFRT